jgi:beta-phosphoglucomutase-like phosphatase (HAD superfamily)
MFATLLDFDGVLVDSEPVHLAAFNDVLAPYGVVITEEQYQDKYLALDDANVFRTVLAAPGARRAGPASAGKALREEEVRALVAAKNPRFLARFEQGFRVFPGAAELVARRARRGPVAIVSGALENEIEFALQKMGVRNEVAFIVSAEHTPTSKPDPGPFLLALEKLRGTSAPTLRAVAVEDSTGGVLSAKGAGLRCVAVTHTYPAENLVQAGADATVPDLTSITDDLLEQGA